MEETLQKQLVTAVKIGGEEEGALYYYMTEEIVPSGGFDWIKYGVEVEKRTVGGEGEKHAVNRVSGDANTVLSLINTMAEREATPETLPDIIKDYLADI